MPRGRIVLLAVLASLALVAQGCRNRSESPFQSRRDGPVRIQVDNNNFLDITIFVEGTGTPTRLGNVTGKSQGSFQISLKRIATAGGVQLRVEPIGSSSRYISPPVLVSGGETILLSVGASLRYSNVVVR